MQKTITRNLLKFSAGRALACPRCRQIADYRRWVMYESPLGMTGACCADCWRAGLAKVHDDRPHAYLLSIGWKVDTLCTFDKPPQKTAKAHPLKTQKQRADDALKGHKRNGNIAKADRFFPSMLDHFKPAVLIGTKTADGIDYNYDNPPQSSPELTREYVRTYCMINNLTMEAA